MYLSKEQAPKSSKKVLIAAAAGFACVGVATISYVNQEDNMDFEQLSSLSAPQMASQFYSKIANPCNQWYHNASQVFLKGQDSFLPQAKFMWEHKLLLTRYGGNAYKGAMNNMLDQIESLTDAQRDLENVYSYSNKYLALVDKNVKKGNKWRVILKWSTKVSQNCLLEEEKQIDRTRKLNNVQRVSSNNLKALAKTFDANAKKDYMKWDCEAMYPMPKQNKVNVLGVILDAAKQGFEIFNEVKGMLPEGAMKNMKIPGLPEGMQAKIGDGVKMFQQGKEIFEAFSGGNKPAGAEEFEEFEEDLIEEEVEELKFIGGESDSAFAERVADRNRYVAMCGKEKKIFAQTIGKTKSMLVKLANHNFVGKTVGEIHDDLASTAAQYGSIVQKFVDQGESSVPTAAEQKVLTAASAGAVAQYAASTAYITKAKKDANIKKAMLLQWGQ